MAAILLSGNSAFASDEALALLKKHNCLGCHQVDGPKVGPSYMDVAKKYRGNESAAPRLEHKVANGGSGVWGKMPMPANYPHASHEDIKIMVKYILSLAN